VPCTDLLPSDRNIGIFLEHIPTFSTFTLFYTVDYFSLT